MRSRLNFAHRRRDALDAAATHVADGKDARHTGFEQMRRAGKGSARRAQFFSRQICTGFDETFGVELDRDQQGLKAAAWPIARVQPRLHDGADNQM
jgi:hypothetical protein